LVDRAWLAVLAIAAISAWLQIRAALPSYLNPDEAYNFLASCVPGIGDAWRINIRNPHPPLYNALFLYLWCKLGTGDFFLRLSSIMAGTAALWMAWLWLRRLLGAAAAVAGVLVLAFIPEVIAMSAELRDYALLLLLAFAALHFLERSLDSGSVRDMLLSGLLLCLALLTHYSAVMLEAAVACYALVALVGRRLPKSLTVAWVSGQAVFAGIFGWLYLTHIRVLLSIGREEAARESWLRGSYFHPESGDRLLPFVWGRTVDLFQYLFAGRAAGIVALGLFLAGAALAALLAQRNGDRRRRAPALLLFLPLAAVTLAALAGHYPYGGSRHDLVLVVPVVAGLAALYGRFARGRIWPALLAGLLLIPPWLAHAQPPSQYIAPQNQRRELMVAAIDRVRELTPPGGLIFTDKQGEQLLRRYVNRTGVIKYDTLQGRVLRCGIGEWRAAFVIGIWAMTADSFAPCLERTIQACSLPPGAPVTVFWAGWGWNLLRGLSANGQQFDESYEFGDNICVFQVPGGRQNAGGEWSELVRAELSRLSGRCRSTIWPDALLESGKSVGGVTALSYGRFYRLLQDGAKDMLPALAVWQLGNRDPHPQFARYMDEREHYISGGFRFTLVGGTPDSRTLLYLIEPAPEN
jgi:hypothetical protein